MNVNISVNRDSIAKHYRKMFQEKNKNYILKILLNAIQTLGICYKHHVGIVIFYAWTTSDINTSGVVISDTQMTSKLWTSGITYCRRIKDVGKDDVGRRLFPKPCWWRVRNQSSNVFLSTVFSTLCSTLEIRFSTSLPLSPTFLCIRSLPTSCNVYNFLTLQTPFWTCKILWWWC